MRVSSDDAGDTMNLSCSGNLLVNGQALAGTVSCAAIDTVIVNGNGGNDSINTGTITRDRRGRRQRRGRRRRARR